MKTYKRYLILALVIALCVGLMPLGHADFRVSADDSSKKKNESDSGKDSKPELSKPEEEKKSYAEKLGEEYGKMYAVRDFARRLKSNHNRHFSTRAEFDKVFNRSGNSDSFFYSLFRKAFKEAYDVEYIKLVNETYQNGDLDWFKMSESYGRVEGQMAALHDFTNEKPKNWKKAYNELVKENAVAERFHLDRVDKQTAKDFEDQFRAYFENEYEKSYLVAINNDAKENTNYEYVNAEAKILTVTKPYYKTLKSTVTELGLTTQTVSVIFPEGSIYENSPIGTPMALRFNDSAEKFKKIPDFLLPQSDIFELDLQRGVKEVRFYQSPQLVFNGFANLSEANSIGVYKWKDGRWKYIPTTRDVKDKKVIANLGLGKYSQTEYALFYDKSYKMPNDIALHWAFEALDVGVRRQHVPYQVKLRPNDIITRAELAEILYRSLYYKNKSSYGVAAPGDVKSQYQDAVKYCLSMGYFTKFPDGTFKPDLPVRYDHFGILMKRIYGSSYDANSLFGEMRLLGHESNFFKKQNPYLTRAEAIQVLYRLAD